MKKKGATNVTIPQHVIPVSDLQRQTSAVIKRVKESKTPVLITQRGRSAAVLISAEEYFETLDRLQRLEELELRAGIALAKTQIEAGQVIPHEEVEAMMEVKWAEEAT